MCVRLSIRTVYTSTSGAVRDLNLRRLKFVFERGQTDKFRISVIEPLILCKPSQFASPLQEITG